MSKPHIGESLNTSPEMRAERLALARHAIDIGQSTVWARQFIQWLQSNFPAELNAPAPQPKPKPVKRGQQMGMF